ncbi:hypothetical protein BDV95DRAFT_559068 [Massariosphaeria phaeospora]|uniref:RanBP2-type domain-containing protein n=1 Tax=Massariosphaeria phaeospora TaxID=100035 RepID=A0A7C8MIS1_9PLEO|nr:hypothetical protein BDV95DRAFT_559068 [Massariosphaeria phaeospora]
MDIPRGHAMLPLNEADFLDFIHNYFKAEYAPIRSFWATATAEPRHASRWVSMGHELTPLGFRPANAQAQKDLESLDYFTRKWNLDAGFVRGLVIRFAKYEVHERLEKKLYESSRLDLMVRKALKEKHLIDALWPSPAPRNLAQELLQQGVKVRQWYGDMFGKYFLYLHSIVDFKLRPEVDARIKSSATLMLVPFVDHLVFGTVDPILPIMAKGAGYSNVKAGKAKERGGASFGEPERFEIRFDTPGDLDDTQTRQVVRQCQCLKCGTKRDVTVIISIDPTLGLTARKDGGQHKSSDASALRKQSSRTAQKYSPGYVMPGANDPAPRERTAQTHTEEPSLEDRPSSPPQQKKQCPRCTFLNHPELTACEMCQADLPATTIISKPPSPVLKSNPEPKPSHSHSASLPPPATASAERPKNKALERPAANRHSLSSSLFSIFPFSQQHQTEHHAHLPPTQPTDTAPTSHSQPPRVPAPQPRPLINADTNPSPPPPQMAMLPAAPSTPHPRPVLPGMPQTLMDDYVPVSPSFANAAEDDENAGWGEMSREEATRADDGGGADVDDEEDDEEAEAGRRSAEGLLDLDEVAREEMGVWGEREDD